MLYRFFVFAIFGAAAFGATPILRSFPGLTINALGTDSGGATVVAGTTFQAGLPTTPNAIQSAYASSTACPYIGVPRSCNDAYVVKVAVDGTLLYATYIGGAGDDAVLSLAVDETGAIYLLGETSSSNFPFTTPQPPSTGASAPFLLKIAPDGTLVFALRLPNGLGATQVRSGGGGEIVLGGECKADSIPWTATYLAGTAPTYGGACYVRLAPNGRDIIASTILAGSEEALAMDIALDAAGNAYLTGQSFPLNFPTTSTSWTATTKTTPFNYTLFAAKVSRDGTTLLGSALFNGEGYDSNTRIAVNAAGEVIVTGTTESNHFPVTPGAFQTARLGQVFTSNLFVVKLKPDFSGPIYSTYLTGEEDDSVSAVLANADGSVTLAGNTSSTMFPTTVNAPERCLIANYYPITQPFIAQIAPDGRSLIYSTFLNQSLGGGYISAAVFNNSAWTLALGGGGIAVLDTSPPAAPRFCAMNAANFNGAGIASGEILTIFGAGLAGSQILFDNNAATILYASDGQVNAIVPEGVTSGSGVTIQAVNDGGVIGTTKMPVVDYDAGLFRDFGTPNIVASNDDGTPINQAHPAQPGSIVRIYGTGFGNTQPKISVGPAVAAPISSRQLNGVTEFRVLVPAPPVPGNPLEVDFTITGTFFQVTGLYLPVAAQ